MHGCLPIPFDRVTDRGGERINHTALHTTLMAFGCDHHFTRDAARIMGQRDGFQWLARKAIRKMIRPQMRETGIGRTERCDANTPIAQDINPASIRPQLWPRCPAQCQQDRVGMRNNRRTIFICEDQCARVVPPRPVMIEMYGHTQIIQPRLPRAQQRRRLETAREHAPAGPDKRLLTQPLAPGPQVGRRKSPHHRPHPIRRRAVTRNE